MLASHRWTLALLLSSACSGPDVLGAAPAVPDGGVADPGFRDAVPLWIPDVPERPDVAHPDARSDGGCGRGPDDCDSGRHDAYGAAPPEPSGAVPAPPAPNPMRLALGHEHACAILSGGAVRCWGRGSAGQLGDGTWRDVGDDEPARAGGVLPFRERVVQLAAGRDHTCALFRGGRVRCWGHSRVGSVGDAVEVPLSAAAFRVDARVSRTCAVLLTGAIECWDDAREHGVVRAVPLGSPATDVQVGRDHACALLASGAVRCWGDGRRGALGYGNDRSVDVPIADVPLGGRAVAITAGARHTCALLDGAGVRCWGDPQDGLLGYPSGAHVGLTVTPARAGDLDLGEYPVAITAGDLHTCARFAWGGVRCWGSGWQGRTGYGREVVVGDDEPAGYLGHVVLGGPAVEVQAGGVHTCAQLSDGSLRCWGAGDHGALGYGDGETIGDDEWPTFAGAVPLE